MSDTDSSADYVARQDAVERADARATKLLVRVLIGAGCMLVVWVVLIFVAFDGR